MHLISQTLIKNNTALAPSFGPARTERLLLHLVDIRVWLPSFMSNQSGLRKAEFTPGPAGTWCLGHLVCAKDNLILKHSKQKKCCSQDREQDIIKTREDHDRDKMKTFWGWRPRQDQTNDHFLLFIPVCFYINQTATFLWSEVPLENFFNNLLLARYFKAFP